MRHTYRNTSTGKDPAKTGNPARAGWRAFQHNGALRRP